MQRSLLRYAKHLILYRAEKEVGPGWESIFRWNSFKFELLVKGTETFLRELTEEKTFSAEVEWSVNITILRIRKSLREVE